MKFAHDSTPERMQYIMQFKPGKPIEIKPGHMGAGKPGTVLSVFPWGNDVAASVQWNDGARETISINSIQPKKEKAK